MRLLTCKGISSAHRHQLINCIKDEIGSLSVPVEIEFAETIRRRQYSSLWYGGLVASIKAHGCVFAVHAVGDVYATLYDKQDGDRELLYVKDKNNSGRFGVDILPYMKTDRALVAALCRQHNRYWLEMDHNNWWEWNFCPMCGQEIEWDKSAKVVWEEKNCNVCGGWLVKRHPAGFWYASSDYIGMDTCYTCWLEECLATNCLGCKRGSYPDCKWIDLKKSYQEEDK